MDPNKYFIFPGICTLLEYLLFWERFTSTPYRLITLGLRQLRGAFFFLHHCLPPEMNGQRNIKENPVLVLIRHNERQKKKKGIDNYLEWLVKLTPPVCLRTVEGSHELHTKRWLVISPQLAAPPWARIFLLKRGFSFQLSPSACSLDYLFVLGFSLLLYCINSLELTIVVVWHWK